MPFDALTDVTIDLLTENFQYWLQQWTRPIEPNPVDCIASQLATTSTFPAENSPGTKGHPYPYRAILFEDEALLSNQELRRLHRAHSGEDRTMAEARAINLDHFVFAYLGVHDPYYAKQTGRVLATKAFGVFFGVELDKFPVCNATRRDLAASPGPPEKEFLLPTAARLYCHYQVLNDPIHGGDFWHYWGAYSYWKDVTYQEKHWKWKIEFHYKNSVPVGKLEAILWPIELVATSTVGAGHVRLDSESRAEVDIFRKKHPSVFIIPYRWDSAYHTFVQASHATASYVLKHRTYPQHADIALSEL